MINTALLIVYRSAGGGWCVFVRRLRKARLQDVLSPVDYRLYAGWLLRGPRVERIA